MRKSRQLPDMALSFIALTCLMAALTGCTKQETVSRPITDISEIVSPDAEPEIVIDGTSEESLLATAEGPSWINRKLYFSNYIHGTTSSSKQGIWVVHSDKTCMVLDKVVITFGTTPLPNGNLAACFVHRPTETQPFQSGVVEITPDGDRVRVLADTYNDIPLGAPNDLIADTKGGIYFTDPWGGKRVNKQPGTAVYYRNPQGELNPVTEWNVVGFPNGCVLSPDGSKFYLNDAVSTTILVYDVNEDGTLSNKRVFAELEVNEDMAKEKKPWIGGDGMTIDMAGNLYVATLLDKGIQIFNKNGAYLGNIPFPISTSNCVFGGDDMSTLYVTCHQQMVYSIQTKIKGVQYPMR